MDEEREREIITRPGLAKAFLKTCLVIILGTAGGLIGAYAYTTGRGSEMDKFLTQYEQTVELLQTQVAESLNSKPNAGNALGSLFRDYQWFPTRQEGFPSFDRFDSTVRYLLPQARARSMSWNPFITNMTAAAGVEAWMQGMWDTLPMNATKLAARRPAINLGITRRVNGSAVKQFDLGTTSPYNVSYYIPVFFISPLEALPADGGDNYAAVLFDLNSEPERRKAFSRALDQRNCSTSSVIYLVQDNPLIRAAGITFCPIYNTGDTTGYPTGFASTVFNWYKILENSVPSYIKGLTVILEAPSFNGSVTRHTFSVSGSVSTDLGKGAIYEKKMEKYRRSFTVSQGITFTIVTYPSKDFMNSYLTKSPRDRTIVVVVFVFVAIIIFLSYDYVASSQSKMLHGMAKIAGKLVDDIFPKAVKERVVKAQLGEDKGEIPRALSDLNRRPNLSMVQTSGGSKHGGRSANLMAALRTRGPSSDNRKGAPQPFNPLLAGPAIADYYSMSTVLFSDVVGFTAWSSSVQPETVFQVLETMFGEFDALTAKFKVYKIETIGDAYMAVTGVPEEDHLHAVHMADFALGMVEAMERVKKQTGVTGLKIRIGMHSGPIVAGVIRSAKMRFQLFGDTVNTASRMESTGTPGRIQVSPSTAELLEEYGQFVLEDREGGVEAKGKGNLMTAWLVARQEGTQPSCVARESETPDRSPMSAGLSSPTRQSRFASLFQTTLLRAKQKSSSYMAEGKSRKGSSKSDKLDSRSRGSASKSRGKFELPL